MTSIPKTLDEISNYTKASKKNIARAYRIENRFMKFGFAPQSPIEYVKYFREKLNLSVNTKPKAIEIIKKASDLDIISGKGPVDVTISDIYIEAILNKERKSQREFADAADVTEVTLRNIYKDLVEFLHIDLKI